MQRARRERFPKAVAARAFSSWKKPIIRRFLQGSAVRFVPASGAAGRGETLAIWGNGEKSKTPLGLSCLRIEDGFLRSVGLGAALTEPMSLVVDDVGIYYDSSRPSALENLLNAGGFDRALLERAAALRARIVAAGITKYNLSGTPWTRPAKPSRLILVPGQVENDASIRYGSPEVRTNIGLLQKVRAANPSAHIVYKPHPDVVAGLRAQGRGEAQAAGFCDEIPARADLSSLLGQVDEVHTMTSFAGFEALLRDVPVVCYGHPFYAGWGLTADVLPLARRARKATLDELVAAALILYPLYISRVTGRYTTPERAVEELAAWKQAPCAASVLALLFRQWRRAKVYLGLSA